MRYPILAAAAIALLPTFALAQTNGAAPAAPAANDGKNFSGSGQKNVPDFSNLPDQPNVTYQGEMAVGTAMPETYSYYPVPQYPDYDYMVLNGQRVIVDHKTHTIYRVMP